MGGIGRRSRSLMVVAAAVSAVALLSTLLIAPTAAEAARPPSPVTLNAEGFAGHGELALVSANALFVLDSSSRSARQVTAGQPVPIDPTFSQDGHWLAFLRPVTGDGADVLWIARGDGADAHQVRGIPDLVEVPDSDGSVMSWSPTRDELMITTGPLIGAPLVPREVWIVSPTGPPHRLLGPGYVNGVAWSPDGAQVAALWSAQGVGEEALETLSPSGGSATTWMGKSQQNTYFLAGWSAQLGMVLWQDQGGGGPSVENYGLPLGVVSRPGATLQVLGTVPVFQPPAVAIGENSLALVVNGNPSSGQGEGEKFVWFGKSLDLCGSEPPCNPVSAPSSSVTYDPSISPVDGSVAFVEAAQSEVDLPPLYSSSASWDQVSAWYASGDLWIAPAPSGSPVQVGDTAGAVDPVFSARGTGLVFVKDQALWLLAGPQSQPVEITGPLQRPPGPCLFGYIDWSDEFAWWS